MKELIPLSVTWYAWLAKRAGPGAILERQRARLRELGAYVREHSRFYAMMIYITGILILTGCNALHIQVDQQTPQPKEVQITEEGLACGSGVGLNVGDTLILILDGNPSTGYIWDVGFYVHPVIEPAGESEYQSDSNQPGAGGKYTFRFLATGEGEAKLMMIYHKPLDKNTPALKTCEVTVIVK